MLIKFLCAKLETNDLVDLTFNSNFICPCQHSCIDIRDYQILEKLELSKLNHPEYDSLFDKDIDNHVRFHDNFDYFSNHKLHTLINFYKLECLLLDLD